MMDLAHEHSAAWQAEQAAKKARANEARAESANAKRGQGGKFTSVASREAGLVGLTAEQKRNVVLDIQHGHRVRSPSKNDA